VADGSCAARTPGEGAAVSIEYEAGWRPVVCRRGKGISPRGGGGKLSASPLPTITEDVQRVFRFLDFKTVGT